MKILLIEGDDALVRRVRELLAPRDVRLASVADGVKGVEAAHVDPPDLILVNVDLPRVTGLEAVRILKAAPPLSAIPVVVLTERADPEVIKEAVDVGAVDVVLKSGLRDSGDAEKILSSLRHARPSA